ncbi:unnamed protein product [Allacma fusca]|uniref:Uncharacterized protein n=1 Tax=Allacma fusca TaxID=39272 RepID=A0A8J2K0U0_9HEXA|nr:unnamed protein product [Allacma fusca]
MEIPGRGRPYRHRNNRGSKNRNRYGEDPSGIFPNVENDNMRTQILIGLSETSRRFLDKPRDEIFKTYLAHTKSQVCSPLQNLRLLEQFGFSFKQEFYCLRSSLAADFPDHACRIVIYAFWNTECIGCRGEGESEFVVLAKELAAAELCERIESRYDTKLPDYSIANVLQVRPGIAEMLEKRCKDYMKNLNFDTRMVKKNPSPRKYECVGKMGQDIVKAYAYNSDIAKFLAAKLMYEKLKCTEDGEGVERVQMVNDTSASLSEERASRYVLVILRHLDLRSVPKPDVNLIPKTLELVFTQGSEHQVRHQNQVRDSSSSGSDEVTSESIIELIPGPSSSVVVEPKPGLNSEYNIPPLMSIHVLPEKVRVPKIGNFETEASVEAPPELTQIASEKPQEELSAGTSNEAHPDLDSETTYEEPEPDVGIHTEGKTPEVSQMTEPFQEDKIGVEIPSASDESFETTENATKTVTEDVTIRAKEQEALRNLVKFVDVNNDFFEPTQGSVLPAWLKPPGATSLWWWLSGWALVIYFVILHVFFLREWLK